MLRFTPPSDGRIDYYQAPPRFDGDWRSARFLVFDKQSSGGDYSGPRDYPGGHGDVELYNGDMLAYFDIEEHHDQGWRTFRIPLRDGAGWQLSGGAQQLSDVLRNVTGLGSAPNMALAPTPRPSPISVWNELNQSG